MQVSVIGLHGIGTRISELLCRSDIHVLGVDADSERVQALTSEPGFEAATTLDALLNAQTLPRIVLLTMPTGSTAQRMLGELKRKLTKGDLLLNFAEMPSESMAEDVEFFRRQEIGYIDVGLVDSRGGAKDGISLMIGGDGALVARVERVFNALCADPNQWLHCGPAGAGHFAKSVQDAVALAMSTAITEGAALLGSKREFDLDADAILECWRHAGLAQSRALDLIATARRKHQSEAIIASLPTEAITQGVENRVDVSTLSAALNARFRAR